MLTDNKRQAYLALQKSSCCLSALKRKRSLTRPLSAGDASATKMKINTLKTQFAPLNEITL